ncbi:MAG: DUF1824 family protein [Microcoleus sp. PH2017_40_RAT_O_B]|uniref:DUF1824 family protein n=1 Tax=unclassified Microcoleus TaxID=2642155 RepID=UPI001DBCD783|nr:MULTISPECIES: DUF1824 family protein [unclassified Microcoleus]MCC3571194.1 DUF1824 family protein [Microcoleus sp. PH2017_34_RAT_O_A]MCC3608808.1 DUF1824 family protein [Microcoleus sp. PH2017_40_RAT_O_B]
MSTHNPTTLTVEAAQQILKDFTCLDMQSVASPLEKQALREAILLVASLSDYQMLGVCATSTDEGFAALATYLKALGYDAVLDPSAFAAFSGSVYIKFNTLKGSYYVDGYPGTYRGVLVSCQSSEEGGVSGTYGHLPLDVFVD